MSEPARQYTNHDVVARTQPGPLRDWLAAMKAAAGPSTEAAEFDGPIAVEAKAPVETTPTPEPVQSWTPRVVAPKAAPRAESVEADVSDLMAENLMLKAKLRVETDRYDALQAVLAQELRALRAHVEDEMQELEEVRAERDRLNDLQTRFTNDLKEMRARMTTEAERLREVSEERDLWMARSEALAQPLFQKR